MGENFVSIMDNYFDVFKEKMNNRFRIPRKFVEDYKDEIFFMVDNDKVYIQAVIPRIIWVKPLPYEVNIDEEKDIIEAFINELVDPKAPHFGTYNEANARIDITIKLPQAVSKCKKRIEKIEFNTSLLLTKGKGEDDDDAEDEEELEKEEELVKKKGKVIITKPPKPSTAVFTRRSKKKGSEVVFSNPPLTF